MTRRPKKTAVEAQIAAVRAEADALGLRLSGETWDSSLPAVRCSKANRAKAEELAAAAGIKLTEHIRRRAITP
jgi:hypothetical protein